MAKLKYKFNFRDPIILVLALGLIFTNYVLFDYIRSQNFSGDTFAHAYVYSEYQINKLKLCIDEHVQTCDITTGAPKTMY